MLIAIRDAESRTRFLGYRVESYKLFVFTLSACMAGVAGALYVPQVGIINPERVRARQLDRGGDLGRGRRPRHADRRGARRLHRQLRQDLAHLGALAPYWLFVLGALFIVVTLFLPKGIVGTFTPGGQPCEGARRRRARARPRAKTASANRTWRSERMNVMDTPRDLGAALSRRRHVSFDGFKALNNLSLMVEPGEMRAIIGPNGAGKTTMMDVITGKTRPDEGEVLFDGSADLTRLDETGIASWASAANSRSRPCSRTRRSQDNLLLALRPTQRQRHAVLARQPRRDRADRRDAGDHPPDRRAHMLAGSLSHGQKQWLEIGMLLAQDPKLLLVDEPVAGMTDVETAPDRRAAEGDQPRPYRRWWSSTT